MKEKKTPMRRCIGCMESKPKKELIRITGHEGQISIDPTGKAKGRGAYFCLSMDCFAKAVKKRAVSRTLEIEITAEQMDKFAGEFEEYEKKNS